VLQSIAELEQVDRVLRRVVEHALSERTHGPIGALMLLVELHPEEVLEQRGEPEGADAEKLGGNPRVEDVPDMPAVILPDQPKIVVGVVKHDFDVRILQQRTEAVGITDWQWIDDRGALSCGELEQVDSIDETVEARPFGIEREEPSVRDRREERLDGPRSVEVERRMHAGNLTEGHTDFARSRWS